MSVEHWETRYEGLKDDRPSWFQEVPATSLQLISDVARAGDRIVDIGGGDGRLVDHLLDLGFHDVTVVDISQRALNNARDRVGAAAPVHWVATDIRLWQPQDSFDIWHDRAAYHFLTEAEDIANYWSTVREAVPPGGYVIIATFADDGPETCSGLAVQRYDEAALAASMGSGFEVLNQFREVHTTPWDSGQAFMWTVARRIST